MEFEIDKRGRVGEGMELETDSRRVGEGMEFKIRDRSRRVWERMAGGAT